MHLVDKYDVPRCKLQANIFSVEETTLQRAVSVIVWVFQVSGRREGNTKPLGVPFSIFAVGGQNYLVVPSCV